MSRSWALLHCLDYGLVKCLVHGTLPATGTESWLRAVALCRTSNAHLATGRLITFVPFCFRFRLLEASGVIFDSSKCYERWRRREAPPWGVWTIATVSIMGQWLRMSVVSWPRRASLSMLRTHIIVSAIVQTRFLSFGERRNARCESQSIWHTTLQHVLRGTTEAKAVDMGAVFMFK